MRGACLVLVQMMALAVAAQASAASGRFVPADPGFVVANVRQAMPDESLRRLVAAWRETPRDEAVSVALAQSFIDHARQLREPMYFGRAEAVLAPVANAPGAGAAPRRLYAETLQYRHDFNGAESLLDSALRDAPRDVASRTQRASVRLVRGDFAGARADCASIMASRAVDSSVGATCLAEALAGAGQLAQARALLGGFRADDGDAAARAYLLSVRGELAERAGDPVAAIADYRRALTLSPNDDSVRAALSDALAARGDVDEASSLLDVERPSLALIVRRALLAHGADRVELYSRAESWLALETARGDAIHNREAAMLALSKGDAGVALAAARANFLLQRELPDVRVLARAVVAAHDASAQRELASWLETTGFRDAVVETILAGSTRG